MTAINVELTSCTQNVKVIETDKGILFKFSDPKPVEEKDKEKKNAAHS